MKFNWLKIFVFILILAFYASLLAHKIELPVWEDLGRHIKNGEIIVRSFLSSDFDALYKILNTNYYSYTEPDHVFINHHWLSGVIFYLVHQAAGWDGLVIFKIIVLLTAFSLLFMAAAKKADFWLVAVLSLPTIFILKERTALRPEIFSFLFIAVSLYFLIDVEQCPERKRIYWLIPLQLLWVNMHIFFVVGIALVGGFLFEKIVLNLKNFKNDPLVKKLIVILLLLIAVSFINPNSATGALYPFLIFNNYSINVSENNSPFYFLRLRPPLDNIPIEVFVSAVILLALSFLFNLRNKPIFYFLSGSVAAIGGLRMFRLFSFFGLIFLPAVSANLNESFIWLENAFKKRWFFHPNLKRILAALFILALGYLTFLGFSGKLSNDNKPGLGLTAQSNSSAEFFKEQNLKGPIFNDYDIGSYLIYHFYPEEKVFIDNRPEAYSALFLTDIYGQMIQNDAKWQEAFQYYQFNAIFMYQYDLNPNARSFIYRRIHDQSWALVYADSYAVILLKNNPENGEVIKKFHITSENAEKKLESLLNSSSYYDQVAAADIFSLLGRPDLEMKTFLRVVDTWPGAGKVWMVMGARELNKNPRTAVIYLDKAISLGRKTAEAYILLGVAYMNAGEPKIAEKMLRKALRINPDRGDAKQLLGTIQNTKK